MEKFGKSQSVKRVEDIRFLTGAGRYVDDIAPQGALFAYFLRSPIAHGTLNDLDLAEARTMPGVHAVYDAQSLIDAGLELGLRGVQVKNLDGTRGAATYRPLLAQHRVRHVGEPLAVIIAETVVQAKDAAETIAYDIDDLPVHLDLSVGGLPLHDTAPDNRAFDWGMGDRAKVDAALLDAAHVVRVSVPDNRIIVNSMEPRGCFAEPDGDRLHVSINGQGVWVPLDDLAYHLGLPKSAIRVTAPDVGGGFGMKAMRYPEPIVIAHAARNLGKPVRWMSDRGEAMLSDNAGRDLTTEATLAFDADLRLTAYMVESIANMGAYNSQFAQAIQTDLFSKVMPGVYDVQTVWLGCTGVYTNTTPVDAYRGAGRPEAIFILERAMDQAARELGVDPWDLRRRNFIRADQFPYTSATGMPYDVGDFHRVLDRLEQQADRAGFAHRRATSEAAGKLRGQGLSYYIESILGDPEETSRIDFRDDGSVAIYVGTQSNGQGHETVYARFLADQTGIPMNRIEVIQGDSDRIPKGGGTGGSRSVTVQNTATLATIDVIKSRFAAFLATAEGADPANISFDDERFRIPGSNLTPTMIEVADMARAAGQPDLLTHSATIKLENRSFPNGAHLAEVEIDPETGQVTVDRYTVVDDFGNLINPMLVEGQVHGGIAQGLGQALVEHAVYDETGQLLSASFMDYGMPRADTMPFVSFTTEGTPSKYNPMGMKGCGEAGTVGSMAAVTNAVIDALGDRPGAARAAMPFTPGRVWEMLQEA